MSETNTIEDPTLAEPGPNGTPDGGAPAPQTADDQGAAETEARRMGWLPREEFRGDPAAWRPAAEFLERGRTILPVLQQQYGALNRRYSELENQLRESRRVIEDMAERTRRTDERAYQRMLRDIEQRRTAAVEAGDTAAFQAADAEMTDLRATEPPAGAAGAQNGSGRAAEAPQATTPPPEAIQFINDNPWLQTSPEARADAVAIHGAIQQTHAHLALADQLQMVREKVARLHPQLFSNPRRTAPSPVAPSTPAAVRAQNPHSFDAMPQESKVAFARYVKQLEGRGKPLTKDEWAQYYWENEG